mmetsp:Transcript_100687/g.290971  ORF Transcript_100687/g.290971 Transcript_100687/m.290971 type:complete len:250 (-) Transcript_100687:757-1506(-)
MHRNAECPRRASPRPPCKHRHYNDNLCAEGSLACERGPRPSRMASRTRRQSKRSRRSSGLGPSTNRALHVAQGPYTSARPSGASTATCAKTLRGRRSKCDSFGNSEVPKRPRMRSGTARRRRRGNAQCRAPTTPSAPGVAPRRTKLPTRMPRNRQRSSSARRRPVDHCHCLSTNSAQVAVLRRGGQSAHPIPWGTRRSCRTRARRSQRDNSTNRARPGKSRVWRRPRERANAKRRSGARKHTTCRTWLH